MPAELPAMCAWWEDRGQLARFGADLLRLDEDERARFRVCVAQEGGDWAVEYRPGGRPALLEGLARGVLPSLEDDARCAFQHLAVLPAASAAVLASAMGCPAARVEAQLRRLSEETILLDRLEVGRYRLSGAARDAVIVSLGASGLAALQARVAERLATEEPVFAAQLLAESGGGARAMHVSRRVGLWQWYRRQAVALQIADGLNPATVRLSGPLALVVANRRLLDGGPRAAWPFLLPAGQRAATVDERVERLRLLAPCCAALGRSASLRRASRLLQRFAFGEQPVTLPRERAFALASLGAVLGLLGENEQAAVALRAALANRTRWRRWLTFRAAATAGHAHAGRHRAPSRRSVRGVTALRAAQP